MELPLTFQIPVYLVALSEVQRSSRDRILDESDIRQFLGSTLRMGFLFYRHPELNLDSCDIQSHGGYAKAPLSTALVLTVKPTGSYINLFRGMAGINKYDQHKNHGAMCINSGYIKDQYPTHGKQYIQLKDVPLRDNELTDDKMPLYLNTPVLCVYARERLAGLIHKEAL